MREYLGFDDQAGDNLAGKTETLSLNKDETSDTRTNGEEDDFFGSHNDSDNFLADLAATKGFIAEPHQC